MRLSWGKVKHCIRLAKHHAPECDRKACKTNICDYLGPLRTFCSTAGRFAGGFECFTDPHGQFDVHKNKGMCKEARFRVGKYIQLMELMYTPREIQLDGLRAMQEHVCMLEQTDQFFYYMCLAFGSTENILYRLLMPHRAQARHFVHHDEIALRRMHETSEPDPRDKDEFVPRIQARQYLAHLASGIHGAAHQQCDVMRTYNARYKHHAVCSEQTDLFGLAAACAAVRCGDTFWAGQHLRFVLECTQFAAPLQEAVRRYVGFSTVDKTYHFTYQERMRHIAVQGAIEMAHALTEEGVEDSDVLDAIKRRLETPHDSYRAKRPLV